LHFNAEGISGKVVSGMKNPKIWHESADVYNWAGMYEEAISCYDRAIAINPADDLAWFRKGFVLFMLDKNEESLECYNRALAINPKNIDALENKGAHLLKMGKEQEAMEFFNAVIQIEERKACAWFNRGMVFKKRRNYWEALASFDTGLTICPNDEDALRCVAEFLKCIVKRKK